MYGSYKMVDLMEYNDFRILKFEKENYYDMREPLTSNQGLMFAAAITGYDGTTNPIEDP